MPNFRKDYNWSKVIDPITDEQVKVWVAALRSGEYKQGAGELFVAQENSYCCLGVAQEVIKLEDNAGFGFLRTVDISDLLLPQKLQLELSEFNDNLDWSFEQIAAFLEEGFGIV